MTFQSNNLLKQYFSIEIAVKLYELLNADDEDARVYEFADESSDIVSWLLGIEDIPSLQKIEDKMVDVLNDSLDHKYPPEVFTSVAEFATRRLQTFRAQGLI